MRPDRGIPLFLAGQYTVLGLGYWEPRLAGCQDEGDISPQRQKLIKRAYSIASPLLDDDGHLVNASELPYLEFYIALVRRSDERPPALTRVLPGVALSLGVWVVMHEDLRSVRVGLRRLVQEWRDGGTRVRVDVDPLEL